MTAHPAAETDVSRDREWCHDCDVTEPSRRLVDRINADFEPRAAEEVIRWLRALPAETFGGQASERVQAALVLLSRGDWGRFVDGLSLLEQD